MSSVPDPPPDSLLPDDWAALQHLLNNVLDAPPEERPALIRTLAGGDEARASALAAMVAECEQGLPLLERPAAERFGSLARNPDAPPLPEVLADRYRIVRELGHGGMAYVYLAHDMKHGRDVAIKVIRPLLASSLGHDRFLREIGIAAQLRHPNIVPLYDSGEIEGLLYFVMPFEGATLRNRLDAEGVLSIPDAVSVLRDVARALAYAHERGVVHRDIKPDNVMMSGGAAVVSDFGIAKAVSDALAPGTATTLTKAGSGIGTPAYMAPEQATGDPGVDQRADLYSLGCLAYELFTGVPPFSGSMHEIIAAHLTTAPQPVNELREQVPPAVASLVERCLQKLPADRPQSARDVVEVLDGRVSGALTSTGSAEALRTSGAVRAIGDSNAPPRAASRRRVAAAIILGALLVAAGVLASRRDPPPAAPLSIAVLPFGSIDADSQLSFVTNGLAEDVASALARVPGVQIKSRIGARAYRGNLSPDVSEAGIKLKADYIMTGTVRQDPQSRWIVSAYLERATDAASVWSDNFVLNPDQQAGAAERIAASLAGELQKQFPGLVDTAASPAYSQRTTNDEAYRLYLRAQEKLSRRGQSLDESADLFRRALQLDPRYARAHSGLAMALALFPHFEDASAASVHDPVMTAARRALALDPTLAQPHVALGLIHQFFLRWDSAAAEFQTAVRLDSRDVEARVQYARHLLFRGRPEEAVRQLRAAREEDPASALVLSWLSYAFLLSGRRDSALIESQRALENDSMNFTSLTLGASVRLAVNRPDEAVKLVTRLREPITSMSSTHVIAKAGDTATARRRLQEEDAEVPQPRFAELRRAFSHLGLGDTASALDALERATASGYIWTSWTPVSAPVFDAIRESPRFKELLRRVNLSDVGSRR